MEWAQDAGRRLSAASDPRGSRRRGYAAMHHADIHTLKDEGAPIRAAILRTVTNAPFYVGRGGQPFDGRSPNCDKTGGTDFASNPTAPLRLQTEERARCGA